MTALPITPAHRDILSNARALISDHDNWTSLGSSIDIRGNFVFPDDPTAFRHSMHGALVAGVINSTVPKEQKNQIMREITDLVIETIPIADPDWAGGPCLTAYNKCRGHDAVLKLLDHATAQETTTS